MIDVYYSIYLKYYRRLNVGTGDDEKCSWAVCGTMEGTAGDDLIGSLCYRGLGICGGRA